MSKYQLGKKVYKNAASYLKSEVEKIRKKIEADDIKEIEQMADDYILSSSYKTSKKIWSRKS